ASVLLRRLGVGLSLLPTRRWIYVADAALSHLRAELTFNQLHIRWALRQLRSRAGARLGCDQPHRPALLWRWAIPSRRLAGQPGRYHRSDARSQTDEAQHVGTTFKMRARHLEPRAPVQPTKMSGLASTLGPALPAAVTVTGRVMLLGSLRCCLKSSVTPPDCG